MSEAPRLAAAIAQRDAVAEILRVIADSPTDPMPMAQAIAEHAARLCDAPFARVIVEESGTLKAIAQYVADGRPVDAMRPMPARPTTVSGRAMLERRTIHLADVAPLLDTEFPDARENWAETQFRAVLAVPLVAGDAALGAIFLWRRESGLFTPDQVALVETFARQAALALENVRLYDELEARNAALTEALEQKTATSEILRVIASSPTDTQPVFDLLAQRAGRLCNADVAVISRYDGRMIELAAIDGLVPEAVRIVRQVFPMRVDAQTISARVIRSGTTVHLPDVLDDEDYEVKDFARAAGYHGSLGVPIMRDQHVVGSLFVGRGEVGHFSESQVAVVQTFADQAGIAIENVRLFKELEARNGALTEALEQQTATSEVLRVISATQVDPQPVFDAIVKSAVRLCDAQHSLIFRFDGSRLLLVGQHAVSASFEQYWRDHPLPAGRGSISGRAVADRRTVHVHDVLAESGYEHVEAQKLQSYRTVLAVPMIRDGQVAGVIVTWRQRVDPFTPKQVELVETFADQAMIAIENVRLFTELETRNAALTEALEQQTATSEILRVISRSPRDVQPVFATIADAALALCAANTALVATFDGMLVHVAAVASTTAGGAEAVQALFPRPPSPDNGTTRAILTRNTVMIPDVAADREFATTEASLESGFRSVLAVPLKRGDDTIGCITVGRPAAGPFPAKQVALLQTFADQAVIAIENVRLFNELGARNAALTEALEQQTATSEILRVISQSQVDVQPVFETIARSVLALCEAVSANVFTFDGSLVQIAAAVNSDPTYVEDLNDLFPRPADRSTAVTRAIAGASVVMIEDVLLDPEYAIGAHSAAGGFRSVLAVPLLRESGAIGGIAVGHAHPGRFPESQVALLQTFADQAVIAIENARLFHELEARTGQLTRSVDELKALGEVGQAVNSSLDLSTVLRTIVARARELSGMEGGSIYEYDESAGEFHLHAADQLPPELVDALRVSRMRRGEGALGRMAVTGKPVQIHDIADTSEYQSRVRDLLVQLGYRSLLAIPLRRDERLLGGLVVNSARSGEFPPHVIALLETFAAQSALAIQNARLFREVEEKSRQLETASRHKSEFLANMSHELRTPLNAIIGFSDVLAQRLFGEINEKQAEYLSDIMESGQHLLALINDILDLSKIEAGRMELDPSEVDLGRLVESTLALVRERAQRRGVALGCTIGDGLGTIRADERKVKQVLLNLLSNAIKFTPEGGHVDVRAVRVARNAEISVTDTGVGIAPGDREAVFEEFRQVGATSRKAEGTGLGLAISRKFVELHGGTLGVTSILGKGSTFTFTLPLG